MLTMLIMGNPPPGGNPSCASAAIRLMVVDDHFVARLGLKRLLGLQKDMVVVAETEGGADAVALYRRHRPDVVLMDIRMPGFDGIAATHTICSEDPEARVLVVSSTETARDIQLSIEVGARGFVTKESGPAELLEAIRVVAAGQQYLPPGIRRRLEDMTLENPLNVRENQILRLMVEGHALPEIACRTSLAPGTVKVYICNILAKLNVNNRAEAVFEATRRGLIRGAD